MEFAGTISTLQEPSSPQNHASLAARGNALFAPDMMLNSLGLRLRVSGGEARRGCGPTSKDEATKLLLLPTSDWSLVKSTSKTMREDVSEYFDTSDRF